MSRGQGETILVVSAAPEQRDSLAGALRRAGHVVRLAGDTAEALDACELEPIALALVDRDLPPPDGFRLTGFLHARHPDAVVLVLCEKPSVEDIVALMKEGAFHVIGKPARPDQLSVVVQKGLEHGRLSRGNRDLQSRLDLSERLAMIGRLASGVAHELNNPLDGVQRYVRLTQEGLESERRELADYLDRAMSGLSRMASIVRQLLTFSRNIVIENEEENLRTMLDEVVRTLAPSGSAAPLVLLENPYVDVKVPRALFQVFVNLVRNALDAVESRG
ncbi:MAG: sensor histidine kinase, partial [Planctomycetota bacterium]